LITPLRNDILTKFGDPFRNLLEIKCTKFCLDSFKFDTSTVQCLGVTFYRTKCKFMFYLFTYSTDPTVHKLSHQINRESVKHFVRLKN